MQRAAPIPVNSSENLKVGISSLSGFADTTASRLCSWQRLAPRDNIIIIGTRTPFQLLFPSRHSGVLYIKLEIQQNLKLQMLIWCLGVYLDNCFKK